MEMEGLSDCQKPHVSQQKTTSLQMMTIFCPSGGQPDAKLVLDSGAERQGVAASTTFQDPQPSVTGMQWKWKG